MSHRLAVFGLKLMMILACFAGAVSSANQSRLVLLAGLNPQAALDVDPHYAPAAFLLGDVLLATDPLGAVPQRVRLARTGLRRQPLAADAVRQIGMARDAGRIVPDVRPYMILAEKLSRRDALAQLWLAQDRFKAGDVIGGMTHLDTVIRVYRQAEGLIFPVLAKFADAPGIANALALRSDAGADWVSGYLNYSLAKSGDLRVIAGVLMAVKEPSLLRDGSDISRETIRELAVAGNGKLARSLFKRASAAGLLGGSARGAAIPWRVFEQTGATAELRQTSEGPVMDILAERGANATIAQQVRFDASERVLPVPRLRHAFIPADARIVAKVRCSSSDASRILWSAEGDPSGRAPVLRSFSVRMPAECLAALYSIEVVGPVEGPALTTSIIGLGIPEEESER
jgi:hypothetical protein